MQPDRAPQPPGERVDRPEHHAGLQSDRNCGEQGGVRVAQVSGTEQGGGNSERRPTPQPLLDQAEDQPARDDLLGDAGGKPDREHRRQAESRIESDDVVTTEQRDRTNHGGEEEQPGHQPRAQLDRRTGLRKLDVGPALDPAVEQAIGDDRRHNLQRQCGVMAGGISLVRDMRHLECRRYGQASGDDAEHAQQQRDRRVLRDKPRSTGGWHRVTWPHNNP